MNSRVPSSPYIVDVGSIPSVVSEISEYGPYSNINSTSYDEESSQDTNFNIQDTRYNLEEREFVQRYSNSPDVRVSSPALAAVPYGYPGSPILPVRSPAASTILAPNSPRSFLDVQPNPSRPFSFARNFQEEQLRPKSTRNNNSVRSFPNEQQTINNHLFRPPHENKPNPSARYDFHHSQAEVPVKRELLRPPHLNDGAYKRQKVETIPTPNCSNVQHPIFQNPNSLTPHPYVRPNHQSELLALEDVDTVGESVLDIEILKHTFNSVSNKLKPDTPRNVIQYLLSIATLLTPVLEGNISTEMVLTAKMTPVNSVASPTPVPPKAPNAAAGSQPVQMPNGPCSPKPVLSHHFQCQPNPTNVNQYGKPTPQVRPHSVPQTREYERVPAVVISPTVHFPMPRRHNDIEIEVGRKRYYIRRERWAKACNVNHNPLIPLFEELFTLEEQLTCTVSGRRDRHTRESTKPLDQEKMMALYACVAFIRNHPNQFPDTSIKAEQLFCILTPKEQKEIKSKLSQRLNIVKQQTKKSPTPS